MPNSMFFNKNNILSLIAHFPTNYFAENSDVKYSRNTLYIPILFIVIYAE